MNRILEVISVVVFALCYIAMALGLLMLIGFVARIVFEFLALGFQLPDIWFK